VGHRTDRNVSPAHNRPIVKVALLSALILAATGASAQTDQSEQPAQPPQAQAVPGEVGEVKAVPRAARPRIASKRAAEINAREAARRLEQAQFKRIQGAEPLPGERIQVNGTTTVGYRYWKRQEQLRLAVEQAQRRWNLTQRVYAGQTQQPPHASGMQLVRHER